MKILLHACDYGTTVIVTTLLFLISFVVTLLLYKFMIIPWGIPKVQCGFSVIIVVLSMLC